MKKVTSKHSDTVLKARIEMLKHFKAKVNSVRADSGLEFADYEHIAEALDTDVYFTDQHVSH